jgi:hypothetical protein
MIISTTIISLKKKLRSHVTYENHEQEQNILKETFRS